MALSDYVVTDDLTIVLGLVAAGLFLLYQLYRPQSLVHPILLGRQSDVTRVRNPGESAVYRNYGTGMMGRFPTRPTKDQQVLLDLVKPESDAPRTLWTTKISNAELLQRISAFGTGLLRVAGLAPQESNVLLLLNDGIEFLITDLALASRSIPSFTLTSLALLSPVLDSHPPSAIITHARFLPALLELIYDSHESAHHTIIVVGDFDNNKVQRIGQVRILRWEDVEREGGQGQISPATATDPQEVFSVSFFTSPSGELQGAQLTHENITAGVAAARALVPLSSAITPLDTIISAFPLNTAYGRAIAYTAIFEGTSFATLESTKLIASESDNNISPLADLQSVADLPIPDPTILYIKPAHLTTLSRSIIEQSKKSNYLLHLVAWRHKLAGVLEGFLTKESLWDRLVFNQARVQVMGKGAGTVRGVIVSGGPFEAQNLTPARIALSVPLVNVHSHPAVAGPVFASHPLDLQVFPPVTPSSSSSSSASDAYAFTYLAPVGPPSLNVEAKLLGVNDEAIEGGADPVGVLLVRGPSVGTLLKGDDLVDEEDKGWIATGHRATVYSNGTFKIANGQSQSSS